jgi:hypothetical protein
VTGPPPPDREVPQAPAQEIVTRPCQVYVLGTRTGCILGSDCTGIQASIPPRFPLRLFNLTTRQVFFASLAGNYLGQIELETGSVTVLEPPRAAPRRAARLGRQPRRGSGSPAGTAAISSATTARPRPGRAGICQATARSPTPSMSTRPMRFGSATEARTRSCVSIRRPRNSRPFLCPIAARGPQGRSLGYLIRRRQALRAKDSVGDGALVLALASSLGLVRTYPLTGKKALYFNMNHTALIEGCPRRIGAFRVSTNSDPLATVGPAVRIPFAPAHSLSQW